MERKNTKEIYHENDWSGNCLTMAYIIIVLFVVAGIAAGIFFGEGDFNLIAMLAVWAMSILPVFLMYAMRNHFVNQEAMLAMIAQSNNFKYSKENKVFYVEQ